MTMFLVNGFQLRGMITGFDCFVVVLDSDGQAAGDLQARHLHQWCRPGSWSCGRRQSKKEGTHETTSTRQEEPRRERQASVAAAENTAAGGVAAVLAYFAAQITGTSPTP